MSTEQLRALRDAANAHSLNDDVPATGKSAAHTLWLVCDRAIATLEAEVTKACDTKRVTSLITDLHEFLSRHSNRWDGESGKHPTVLDKECREVLAALEADGAAEQPARTAVPPMPPRKEACEFDPRETVVRWGSCQHIHAAAQATATERDAALERAEEAERMNQYHSEGEAMWRNAERVERERADKAERERDEARAHKRKMFCLWCLAAVCDSLADPDNLDAAAKVIEVCQDHDRNCEKNPLRADLAALKAQHEAALADGENCCEHGDHPAPKGKRFCSDACARCERYSENGCDGICQRDPEEPVRQERDVQPPDSVPLAQHEAEKAEARRAALTEALELVKRDRAPFASGRERWGTSAWAALSLAVDGIRALRDVEG